MIPRPAARPRTVVAFAAQVAVAAALAAGCSTPASTQDVAPPSSPPPSSPVAPAPTGTPVFVTPPAVATGTPGQPRGATPAVMDKGVMDPSDATAVASAFTDATFTVDTALDRSRFDAQVRSTRWATPAYAAALSAPVPATGDTEVADLAAHHGFTTVALTPNTDDGRPTDELRAAARSFTVTATGHGDDRWTQVWATRTIYVFLTRAGADVPWQVDRVQFTSTTAPGAGR